ncbi:MAG: sigma-70 family RNA polymerase sigma factor [Bacteroidetes bacterium]|nr:sigma-70 family RNA polymerase sigma factor [Bacteroidota bacterium]
MTANEYNLCVDELSDRVFRFALKSLRDEDHARDVVQDCFEKLWLKKEGVEFAKAKSYLFTSAYNIMVDFWRREKFRGEAEGLEETLSYEQHQYSGLKPIINRALDRLPEIQRTVLMLRDYEGYDYAEIGRICELNESQVKVYIYRARMAMKNYLGSIKEVLG